MIDQPNVPLLLTVAPLAIVLGLLQLKVADVLVRFQSEIHRSLTGRTPNPRTQRVFARNYAITGALSLLVGIAILVFLAYYWVSKALT